MTAGQDGGWTIKLVLIWLTYLYALLCIAFIADLIPILHLSGFCRRFCRAARQICFNQSEALPRSGQWHVISMEFLHPFFRRHFAGKQVGRREMSKVFLGSIIHYYCIYFFCESLQETIMNITEVSEAAITVRGTFFPPGINQSFSLVNIGSAMLFLPH